MDLLQFKSFAVCILLIGKIENSWEWQMTTVMRSGRLSDLWTFYLLCDTNPPIKNPSIIGVILTLWSYAPLTLSVP